MPFQDRNIRILIEVDEKEKLNFFKTSGSYQRTYTSFNHLNKLSIDRFHLRFLEGFSPGKAANFSKILAVSVSKVSVGNAPCFKIF